MAAHCEKRREGKKNPDSKVININLNLNTHHVPSPRPSPRPNDSRSTSRNRADHPPKYDDIINCPPHFSCHAGSSREETGKQGHAGNHHKGGHESSGGHLRAGYSHSKEGCYNESTSKGHTTRTSVHHKHEVKPQAVKIKLKPGQYKINVELDSDSNPLRIKLTPQNSEEFEKKLLIEQEPLYYYDERTRSSLPGRIQKFFGHSRTASSNLSHQKKHNAHFRPKEHSHYIHNHSQGNAHWHGQAQGHVRVHHLSHAHTPVHKHLSHSHVRKTSPAHHIPVVEQVSSEINGDKPDENPVDDDSLNVSTDLGKEGSLKQSGSTHKRLDELDEIEDFAPSTEQDTLAYTLHSMMPSDPPPERCDILIDSHKIVANDHHTHEPKVGSLLESPSISCHSTPTARRASKSHKLFDRGPNHQRKSKSRLAERKKVDGNTSYRNKNYRDALQLYTEAINLCPDCASYYSNRSACYMMLGKYSAALVDSREAVRLDPGFVKGYIRVAKCNIALGDANAALSILRRGAELDSNNKALEDESNTAQQLLKCQDEVAKAASKFDYRTAIFHLDRGLDLAVGCNHLKILKAEYLAYLQRYGDSQEIANEIIQADNGNVDALFVRGLCLYYQDNCEQAFNHFQHVLRLAPDHKKAKEIYKKAKVLRQKKEEGNLAFNKGQLVDALSLYSEALEIDPNNRSTRSKLYFNRATVRAKLNKMEEAVEDCTAAINLDEAYLKAYLRRAKCYQELDKHDDAVRDYDKVFKMDKNPEHKRLLQESKLQQKRAKRKDYYRILGIDKAATEDEIKKSYRKKALQFHPDRHASASDKEKRDSELKFKEVGEAYTVLTDSKKRALYDRGQDINDPDAGFFHEDVDPNQLFQTLFSTGPFGGHPAGFGGFHGAGGFSGGGFPGGFHFQFG